MVRDIIGVAIVILLVLVILIIFACLVAGLLGTVERLVPLVYHFAKGS